MYTVCMEALVDRIGQVHEAGHLRIGEDDVGGGDRFLLVEPPDVQFVDGEDAGDLDG